MSARDRIVDAVFRAADEINQGLPPDGQIEKSLHTRLLGEDSRLESLTVVNLAVEAEIAIEDDFGRSILLTDARAAQHEPSPFQTIATLIDYVELRLNEDGDG